MKLSIVVYTDRLIPARFAGYTIGPVILIRPSHRWDRGLLEHERVHVAQFWRTLGLCGIGYLLSRQYRLRCEVEAYREQLRWDSSPVLASRLFARFLAQKYDLGISEEQALAELGCP